MTIEQTSTVDTVLDAFETHLLSHRGVCAGTQELYARHAYAFLLDVCSEDIFDSTALTPQSLTHYVVRCTERYRPSTVHCIVTALRSFLRFLELQGLCDEHLRQSVPTVAYRQASGVPKILDAQQLESFLLAFDRSTRGGMRGYAIALCLVVLGLRAGEVACLTLDDVDWRCGTLRVNCGKTRRPNLLPLPTSVGQAIVEYLRRARPDSSARQIFVRHAAPWGAPICASVVRALIRRAFSRCGIKAASVGTHILRRTAATHMVQNGASFKEIADVLGHRSLNTTKLYAKVNLPALAQVALPWPGGAR